MGFFVSCLHEKMYKYHLKGGLLVYNLEKSGVQNFRSNSILVGVLKMNN
jgi:hypothetical protein